MYLYPGGLTDRLLDFLASAGPPLVPSFDVPLQHADPEILKAMGRPFAHDPGRVVDRIRARFPEAALRTSLIVGFPGETEERFRTLLAFVERTRFANLGVFAFCDEEGTPAHDLPGKVPPEVASLRRKIIMECQAALSREQLEAFVGRSLDVLVDAPSPEWPGLHLGRTWFQAPEIDGVTYVSGPGVAPGRTVRAEIVEAAEYDLVALA